MENDQKVSFDQLVAYRHQLQQFCSGHEEALRRFQQGVSFKLNLGEVPFTKQPRHLSSTATCLESLWECPEARESGSLVETSREFSRLSINEPAKEWVSDGSASIYCRCRTLPFVVSHLESYSGNIEIYVADVLKQQIEDVRRLGIGEAWDKKEDWYPPNAYHTFWTLRLLSTFRSRFPAEFQGAVSKRAELSHIERSEEELLLWGKQAVGYQIALHTSDSSSLDSDQLAWAIVILVTFTESYQTTLAQQDFLRQAFRALFEQQNSTGAWRTGGPLFHYRNSGNAYCYVFETFSMLLKTALESKREAGFLRQTLRPYAFHLIKLWDYAKTTAIPLSEDGRLLTWSSGHRVNKSEAESWATASVYAYAQNLRRLIGIWTREAAAEQLRIQAGRQPDPKDPFKKLVERGATWTDGTGTKKGLTAAEQLMTLFVNPVRYFSAERVLEPDGKVIEKDQARAAILFGPPGTSKTTLSESLANAIGWDYLELHASHFVAEGLPNVQRTANRIFEQLLELDRTVILFDEIDELVRSRGMEHDAFGRFLTTSMLPKLAELWKLGKVIYFVATNHIKFFDPAITRAQRFDALIHVAPPSLDRKLEELRGILAKSFTTVMIEKISAADIEKSVVIAAERQRTGGSRWWRFTQNTNETVDLPDELAIAKFMLMRWDQIQELAAIIERKNLRAVSVTVTQQLLGESLLELSDPSLQTCRPYRDYQEANKYEQQDFGKIRIWEVRGNIPPDQKVHFREAKKTNWWVQQSSFGDLVDFPTKFNLIAPGIVEFKA